MLRWPWTKPEPIPALRLEPRLTLSPPAPTIPLIPWASDAYIHSIVVAVLSRHGDNPQYANLRPVLLDHARKLVEVLQGDVPAVSGNVLRFRAKAQR